jgi:hypothetical protein
MMRVRNDMHCFHEPFGEAWYYGEEARWPRKSEDSPHKRGLTFDSVLGNLESAARSRPVFSKDMAHFTDHLWQDGFLSRFKHTFLIRHPHKAIYSIHRNNPDFDLAEIGIDKQRRLFEIVHSRTGEFPPVLDSDDLLEDPHRMVQIYCEAVNIPFIPEALSWQPGSRAEVSWYDQGSWHDALKNSDGLKPQPHQEIDMAEAPERVLEICDQVMPHYLHLHRHRLRRN